MKQLTYRLLRHTDAQESASLPSDIVGDGNLSDPTDKEDQEDRVNQWVRLCSNMDVQSLHLGNSTLLSSKLNQAIIRYANKAAPLLAFAPQSSLNNTIFSIILSAEDDKAASDLIDSNVVMIDNMMESSKEGFSDQSIEAIKSYFVPDDALFGCVTYPPPYFHQRGKIYAEGVNVQRLPLVKSTPGFWWQHITNVSLIEPLTAITNLEKYLWPDQSFCYMGVK